MPSRAGLAKDDRGPVLADLERVAWTITEERFVTTSSPANGCPIRPIDAVAG